MLQIAAKIAQGAFQGSVCGVGEGGQRIPCSWDFSDGSAGDEEDEDENDGFRRGHRHNNKNKNVGVYSGVEVGEEEEDDYGFSLGKTVSGKDVRVKDDIGGGGGSWEID